MQNNLTVTPLSLFFAASLVLIAIFISLKQHLSLEKDLVISVIRAIIQLTIVGYLLTYIIKVNNAIFTVVMVLLIIFNASWNAAKRSKKVKNAFWISFISIFISTSVTMSLLVISGSIKFIPAQMITVSGMVASNSMVAAGLCFRNMYSNFRDQRQQVMEKLALGADLKQSSISIIRESIKTGMAPTIDSAKTVGIVSLPGMMSGLIFAGIDPTKAIMYQIMVAFMLLSATGLSSISICYLSYKSYFNKDLQLI
ncbi:ABC transporter permease [Oenococcus alcoholitolerans]|uniref:Membrane protein n=1 Tax=Oenococcus alcoholitolerans TaxID=931074 RepID=A0ABR4XR81_9LACO|nr:membrane protein [Oenococcus alcoholitolerans]